MTRHRAKHRAWTTLHLWAVLLGLVAVFNTRSALAQSAQETALARSLFEEGVQMADRADWPGAADRFGRAYALKPTSGIAFNYASALIELTRLVEASELLRSVARDPAAAEALKQQSAGKLAEIEPRIGYVILRIEGEPGPETHIDIDGREVPRVAWGVASPIDPGEHVVHATRDGVEVAREPLHVNEGERRELLLPLGPVAVTPEPEPSVTKPIEPAPLAPPQDDGESARRPLYKNWMLWTAVGVAVAGGVVAGMFLVADPQETTEAPIKGDTGAGVLVWK